MATRKQTPSPAPSRLIRKYERNGITKDQQPLEDLLMVLAETIEDSLIQSGAKPGVDYTYLDLYQLANPYALEMFKSKSSKVSFLG